MGLFTSEQFQAIEKKLDELLIECRENRMEIQKMATEVKQIADEMTDESNREEIFKLIDIEIRRHYRRGTRNTTPEEHEEYMKVMENHYRELNSSTPINKLIEKYINLKNRNDNWDIDDENHKFSVFLDNLVHSIFQGYIVQFIVFLITGESYGRYEGYWNNNPENNEVPVNDIEDIGKNHGEKLEANMPLITNDINNSITNTLCFFRPSNEPEKNEVLTSSLPNQQLK